jgi:glutamate N-acetyltransferase/amino-acid N-acetyltransferase
LQVDKEHLAATSGRVRVVAINAGNANCAAGQAGLDAAYAVRGGGGRVWVPAGGGFSFFDGGYWGSAAGGEAGGGDAGVKADLGAESIISAGGAGDSDYGFGGEDGVCAGDGGWQEVRIAAVGKGSGMIHPRLVPEGAGSGGAACDDAGVSADGC